jgi:two-component system phosphate regulon response regulator PhoB
MNPSKKVLIVEDDKAFRTVLSEKLKAEGIEVSFAVDGRSGLDVALKTHPDLICLDVMLPIMTGIEMIRELRNDDWGKKACIILLTQVNSSSVVADALENGVLKYFVKADHPVSDIVDEVKKYFSGLNN